MSPTISVIMPAYNCEPFIKKAIGSILDQTFSDFELIVCEGGSSDNTWKAIDSFSDLRIRKFRNEVNKGYLKTYNFLLTQAKGDFITCQDADDWSEITRLEEQLAIFKKRQDVSLVGCSGGFYYGEARLSKCPPFVDGYVTTHKKVQPFILPAILFKKEVLTVVSGFHDYFDRATSMDQYFIFNILSHFKGYAFDRHLYTHRFNMVSNLRTLDNFRKATAHEAYLILRSNDWQQVSIG